MELAAAVDEVAASGPPQGSRSRAESDCGDIEAGQAVLPDSSGSRIEADKAVAAPSKPVSLTADIESYHPSGRHPPEILKDVRASFAPRSLTAMLGQSGSGKTTLLNILSGRGGGTFRGSLQINGADIKYKALKFFASMVPQDDIMYDTLTASETLTFYARLRLPNQTGDATKERVEALLSRLGLAYAADVQIGNALHPGISGGQRKRLSIGMELVDSPSLLFLDEPTSGLDSRNQDDVVTFLRELANDGCTVVTTIHSPSTAVYCQFDAVLLLVRHIGVGGGSMAFQGTVAEEIAYFASLGSPLPPFANPAEHALSCLDADYGPLSLPSLWRLRRMHRLYLTLPKLVGADAAAVHDSIRRLCEIAARCALEGDELTNLDCLADLDAFSHAVAAGGGTYLAFVNAMVACLLTADAGLDKAAALALGLPSAASAPRTVERLNDIAQRMSSSRWIVELQQCWAAAISHRMDITIPSYAAQKAARAAPSSAPQVAGAAIASSKAAEQHARLQRALDTGAWSWRLPAADAADVLRALGYEATLLLEARQTSAFVETFSIADGSVLFGDLAAALCLHTLPELANKGAADGADGALRALFPALARLDGSEFSPARVAAFSRFLDFDGDGSFSEQDAARWLQGCSRMRIALDSASQPAATNAVDDVARAESRPAYATGGFTQWRLLLHREFLMLGNDRRQLITVAAATIVIPLFLGGMYWRIAQTQASFTNLVAALFLSCLFAGVLPLNTTMMTFPQEQVIVKREYGNGCFSSLAYYASKAVFLSLTRGGQSVLVSMLIFFMAGIYPRPLEFGNVVIFFLTLVLVVIWSSCAGLMFGIVVPDAASAAAVSMPFVLIQILFSGFYLTKAAIPPWFIWAYYISFFRYSLAILVKNLFHDLRFKPCNGKFCPFGPDGSGRDVERQYGVAGDSMAMLFGVCVGYAALIIAIGYVALVLQLRTQLKRKPPAAQRAAGSLAERVLDLPPYALKLASSTPASEETLPATAEGPRRLLRWRRGARAQTAAS